MPTAVILRALGLGDYLTGLPAITLLRQTLPEHRLLLAAPAVFKPLLDLGGGADDLLPTGELQPIRFHGAVDVGIDLHGNGLASRRLLQALNPQRLVGFADPAGTIPGHAWRSDEHEVDRWCRLVTEAFGLPAGSASSGLVQLAIPDDFVIRGCTIVHPGAASGSRRWPADRFVAVAKALILQGHRVVVTGSAGDAALADRVARAAGCESLTNLTLRQLFALVAHARLVVCGDTGVAHVASAYRTPSVLLFGPVSPLRWGPPAAGPHRVLWHGDGSGDPHGSSPDPALLRIHVAEVLRAVAQAPDREIAL